MARTRQLSELRQEVRERADCENDPHITDSELTRYINQSGVALYDEITALAEGDELTSVVLTTVPGTELYTIAADFYRLASTPPIATLNGRPAQLRRWQVDHRAALLDTTFWHYDNPGYYRLMRNDQISFLPVPDGVYSIEVFYIPALADMVADTDTFDGRAGWEEWVVLDAAIKCLIKEDGDISELSVERDRVFARIRPKAAAKDMAGTDKVRDVDGSCDY